MGSDSDLPVMIEAAHELERNGVECETTIVSAHRTPERMVAFAEDAHARGIRVIIAGAGGAAHLPGMTAALTSIPVIGVPVRSSFQTGLDSLLSIVQMPRGVPVATVAVNGARNAALLALRMLAIDDEGLYARLEAERGSMRDEVLAKATRMEHVGALQYLEEMGSRG